MDPTIPDTLTGEYTADGKPYLKFITFNDIKADFLKAWNSDAPSPLIDIDNEKIGKIDQFLGNIHPELTMSQIDGVEAIETMVDSFFSNLDTNGVREVDINPEVAMFAPQAAFTPSSERVMQQVRADMAATREAHRGQLDIAQFSHESAWGKDGGFNFLGW